MFTEGDRIMWVGKATRLRQRIEHHTHHHHKSKNEAVVELTLPEDANIYASKYQLYLPSKQELAEQLAIVRREVGGRERKG